MGPYDHFKFYIFKSKISIYVIETFLFSWCSIWIIVLLSIVKCHLFYKSSIERKFALILQPKRKSIYN